MQHNHPSIKITKEWILEFVIGKDLCPFASKGYINDLLYFQYSAGLDLKSHLSIFWEIITKMLDREEKYISNSFLVMDERLSYDGLLQLSAICQEFLKESKLVEVFQLVEFHPELFFGDHEENDPSHYINRSPFPMLHVLRVGEVSDAIKSHPDVSRVTEDNVEKMRVIGVTSLKKGLDKYINMH